MASTSQKASVEVKHSMIDPQQLVNRISKLSPQKREAVEKLVEKLEKPSLTLEQAVTEFERQHPELLRLLAQ